MKFIVSLPIAPVITHIGHLLIPYVIDVIGKNTGVFEYNRET